MILEGVGSTGNRTQATIDSGRLFTDAVNSIRAAKYSIDKQLWAWCGRGNFDATDTWLMVTNNSRDKLLRIQAIMLAGDATGRVQIHTPAFPTLAGTLLTAVRLNNPLQTTTQPDATGYADETGNTQANVIMEPIVIASTTLMIPIEGMISLGYHESLAIDFTVEQTYAAATIIGWFE